MSLNYLNPEHWGKSQITDTALRLQQIKAETTEFRDTLAHTQLGANAEKLGGWDNAMIVANAIERGDIEAAREWIVNYPESRELVERVITVSEKYRQR